MYAKTYYAFDAQGKPLPATIRNYREADSDELIDIQRECFPPPFPPELWWNREQLGNHVRLYPEGAICAVADGRLVGSMTALRVHAGEEPPRHSWEEITDRGYIRNHQPDGDTLYVVDISVRPAYRKYGFGKALMQSMYELVIRQQMVRLLGGARMSGYHRVADRMTAEEYAREVVSGGLRDPVITFLLKCGRTPVRVEPDYLEDEESRNYALLMAWNNPFLSKG